MVPLKASLLFQLDLNRNILERVQALWEKEKKVTICVIVVWGGFFLILQIESVNLHVLTYA